MGGIVVFIAVVVLLQIGPSVLGAVNGAFDCSRLSGYVANASSNAAKYPANTWAGACHATQQSSIGNWALIAVIGVLVAVGVLLMVIRYIW